MLFEKVKKLRER